MKMANGPRAGLKQHRQWIARAVLHAGTYHVGTLKSSWPVFKCGLPCKGTSGWSSMNQALNWKAAFAWLLAYGPPSLIQYESLQFSACQHEHLRTGATLIHWCGKMKTEHEEVIRCLYSSLSSCMVDPQKEAALEETSSRLQIQHSLLTQLLHSSAWPPRRISQMQPCSSSHHPVERFRR